MKDYLKLEQYIQRYTTLLGLNELVDWDVKVVANSKLNPHAKKLELIQQIKSELIKSKQLEGLIEAVKSSDLSKLNAYQRKNLQLIEKERKMRLCIPDDLSDCFTAIRAQCLSDWELAKAQNNYNLVSDSFAQMIKTVQEVAQVKSERLSVTPYEALMMDFDDAFTEKEIAFFFDEYLKVYPVISASAQSKTTELDSHELYNLYSKTSQEKLCKKIMEVIGFDFKRGRLDESSHPFCTDTFDDVRITVRYSEVDIRQPIASVLHESGHAIYRFNLPQDLRSQLVGNVAGYAMDEAQAILFERMFGRSQAFLNHLTPEIAKACNTEQAGKLWNINAERLFEHYYRITPSLIRVYADEATYPLHIIVRHRLEQAMLNGDLSVKDLPGAWNELFYQMLGIKPATDLEGCLQDIHWFWGLWGYFPTYTMGSFIAAQLFSNLRSNYTDIDSSLERADFDPIVSWLTKKVYNHASLYNSHELLEYITGEKLNISYFVEYVKERFKCLAIA